MAIGIRIWIGRRIQFLRTEKGWTQQILADHADMNREHLSELENGKRDPACGMVEKLTRALGVTMEEFSRGR
jgi:putative transcriptional regulator